MSIRHFFLSISLLLIVHLLSAQSGDPSSTLTLVFAGDIMGHDDQIASAKTQGDGTYYYNSNFGPIESYLKGADIAIGNLEVTFAGPPYKGYPSFSSPDELATTLKEVGFDILVNANNHAIDRRKKGLERTLKVLDENSLVQTGVFKNPAARAANYPLIVEKNNIRIGLLNYTYGTNGIRVTPPNIVNYIDTTLIKKDLKKAKLASPDFIIAIMHWGDEYKLKENATQRRLARFLIQNGADAIIGHHPHVVQPITLMDEHLVVYSLGNMISNITKRYTDGGILLDLTLEKSAEGTRLRDYHYLPIWVHQPHNDKGHLYQLIPANVDSIHYESLLLNDSTIKNMKLFLEDTRRNLPGVPERKLEY